MTRKEMDRILDKQTKRLELATKRARRELIRHIKRTTVSCKDCTVTCGIRCPNIKRG